MVSAVWNPCSGTVKSISGLSWWPMAALPPLSMTIGAPRTSSYDARNRHAII
jgi:hypothetical protein